MNSIEKFSKIGDIIDEDGREYSPVLTRFDDGWYVDWMILDEVGNYCESVYQISNKDIEIAIDNAYKWYREYVKNKKDLFVMLKKNEIK